MKYGKLLLSLRVNHFTMKKFLGIFFLLMIVAIALSSCERNCVCKNLEDGSEDIYYGAYSRSECNDVEDSYNTMYGHHVFECTYK